MNQTKPAVVKKPQERFRNIHAGRNLYTAFLVPAVGLEPELSIFFCEYCTFDLWYHIFYNNIIANFAHSIFFVNSHFLF